MVKASKDGLIAASILKELETIELPSLSIDKVILEIDQPGIYDSLALLFSKMTSTIINTTRVHVRKTVNDGDFLWQVLFADVANHEDRPQFSFKINILINEKTDIEEMLGCFDYIFCIRSEVKTVKSGLCLGTKHFVVDDKEIVIMAFSLKENVKSPEWIEKGAKAVISFQDPESFSLTLKAVAHDLLANYLAKH